MAADWMPMTPKQVGRFAEDMASTNRVFDTATNAEVKAATWEHRHNCQHRAPKVARQLKLEDRK